MTRQDREAAAAAAYPLGSMASVMVHGIGGRSELVSGAVVGHRRGDVHIATASHGTLAVPLDKVREAL